MKVVYDIGNLINLQTVKRATRWNKSGFINADQLAAIKSEYPSNLYHPNLMISILLFIATSIAISGVNGLFFVFVSEAPDAAIGILMLAGGCGAFFLANKVFVDNNHHYRSGVTEAIIYTAGGFLVGGFSLLTDWDTHVILLSCVAVLAFVSIRYLDLICTVLAINWVESSNKSFPSQ
jgi:hypothetical protein